jgi:elongation factor G
MESIEFPNPVIRWPLTPKTEGRPGKMGVSPSATGQEAPTLRHPHRPDTGQTILAGMGELHLEIIVDRLQREFGVGANVGKPQVAYRETIRSKAEAQGRFVRQTGGRGQYGDVKIRIEPLPLGSGYEFVDDTYGGSIPKDYTRRVEPGIGDALEGGILAAIRCGHQVTLYTAVIRCRLLEIAFKSPGQAIKKARKRQARPSGTGILLKWCPVRDMGDVIGDWNSRRGRVEA